MAPETPESHSVPLEPGDFLDPFPGSSSLRVSPNTLFESGIPPAREHASAPGDAPLELALTLEGGVERLEVALSNAVRTEANLGLLLRGLKHLSASAQTARAANDELMHELDELRVELTRNHEEDHALRFRMSQLEQLLEVIRHEASSERAFLIEQQDLFLVEILTDHDRQLGELRRQLLESAQHKIDAPSIDELIAQRDQAREYATRCERERDLAWQELAACEATPMKAPAPPAGLSERSKSGTAAIGSIRLRSTSVSASSAAPDTERSSERAATGYSVAGDDIGE